MGLLESIVNAIAEGLDDFVTHVSGNYEEDAQEAESHRNDG